MEYNKKIDGYELIHNQTEESNREGQSVNIAIIYKNNGEVFAESPVYKKVNEEKVALIDEKLSDYTTYNSEQDCLCQTIPFFSIMEAVERIIYN